MLASVSLEALLPFSQPTPCGGLGVFESVISFSWIIFAQAPALSCCGWLFDFLASLGWAQRAWLALVRESRSDTSVTLDVDGRNMSAFGRLRFLRRSFIH